jgi:hypothetical protein
MLGQTLPGFIDSEVLTVRVMSNHFHPVVETPRAGLVAGMKWLLGTSIPSVLIAGPS